MEGPSSWEGFFKQMVALRLGKAPLGVNLWADGMYPVRVARGTCRLAGGTWPGAAGWLRGRDGARGGCRCMMLATGSLLQSWLGSVLKKFKTKSLGAGWAGPAPSCCHEKKPSLCAVLFQSRVRYTCVCLL